MPMSSSQAKVPKPEPKPKTQFGGGAWGPWAQAPPNWVWALALALETFPKVNSTNSCGGGGLKKYISGMYERTLVIAARSTYLKLFSVIFSLIFLILGGPGPRGPRRPPPELKKMREKSMKQVLNLEVWILGLWNGAFFF